MPVTDTRPPFGAILHLCGGYSRTARWGLDAQRSSVTIGSCRPSQWEILAPEVRSEHATLVFRTGVLWLVPGKDAETRVDDQRIDRPHRLAQGARIHIGTAVLLLELGEGRPTEEDPALLQTTFGGSPLRVSCYDHVTVVERREVEFAPSTERMPIVAPLPPRDAEPLTSGGSDWTCVESSDLQDTDNLTEAGLIHADLDARQLPSILERASGSPAPNPAARSRLSRLALALTASILAAGLYLIWAHHAGPTSQAPTVESFPVPPSTPATSIASGSTPQREPSAATATPAPIDLTAAVTDLCSGDTAKALNEYEKLLVRAPNDAAFRHLVRILQRRLTTPTETP